MDAVKTTARSETWEIELRLIELGLTLEGLLKARDIAGQESANSIRFHAANAAGSFSYHAGTWALRNRLAGADWADDRSDGVEAIKNDTLKVKLAFSNVDVACTPHMPRPEPKRGREPSARWVAVCSMTLLNMRPVKLESGSSSISWSIRMVLQNSRAQWCEAVPSFLQSSAIFYLSAAKRRLTDRSRTQMTRRSSSSRRSPESK